MSVKTNETANTSQVLLDIDNMKDVIKEGAKGTLQSLLKESIREFMKEAIDGSDTDDEDIEKDVEQTDIDTTDGEAEAQEAPESKGDEGEGESETDEGLEIVDDEEPESDDDGWAELEKYKVKDDTYDVTGEKDGDTLMKVYKLMKDDDDVVYAEENGKLTISDKSTGAEYVIELGTEDCSDGDCDESVYECVVNEEVEDYVGFPSKEENEFELNIDDDTVEAANEGKENNDAEKIYEMDLGYTDSYQKRDVIKGLSNTEPSKSGRSWDAGVPKGTKKPWAGKTSDKGTPFEKTVNEEAETELEEGTNVGGAVQQRSNSKSHIPANRAEHGPKVKRHVSTGGDYKAMVEHYEKLIESYKKSNKALKENLVKFQKNLSEARVVNVSLAKIARLFTENAVTRAEKKEIVDRFSTEATTVEKANQLYESYQKQLSKGRAETKQLTLESKETIGAVENKNLLKETKDQSLLNTLDLIKRVEEL